MDPKDSAKTTPNVHHYSKDSIWIPKIAVTWTSNLKTQSTHPKSKHTYKKSQLEQIPHFLEITPLIVALRVTK